MDSKLEKLIVSIYKQSCLCTWLEITMYMGTLHSYHETKIKKSNLPTLFQTLTFKLSSQVVPTVKVI